MACGRKPVQVAPFFSTRPYAFRGDLQRLIFVGTDHNQGAASELLSPFFHPYAFGRNVPRLICVSTEQSVPSFFFVFFYSHEGTRVRKPTVSCLVWSVLTAKPLVSYARRGQRAR